MARRSEASPFTSLGTLTIGRVAALASHSHSPRVTRGRIKPRPPGEKGGPRGRTRPPVGRGTAPPSALPARAEAEEGAAFAPPAAGPGDEISFSLATLEVGLSLSLARTQDTSPSIRAKTWGLQSPRPQKAWRLRPILLTRGKEINEVARTPDLQPASWRAGEARPLGGPGTACPDAPCPSLPAGFRGSLPPTGEG